ncbi:MAG: A24 family peptidase [Planctomycetaceae bacterium]
MALSELLLAPFQLPDWQTSVLFAVVGALLTAGLTHIALRDCGERDRGWSLGAAFAAACCCGLFTYGMLTWKLQETPNVRPDDVWWHWRIGHHVVLICLMLAVTTTDLRAYLIPDSITRLGIVWGVALAALSGDLQIEHIWVDWNQEIPQLRGPTFPSGLHTRTGTGWFGAWPAPPGAFGTWLIRELASRRWVRKRWAWGDVTLMAMIGAFLGWQPTLIVLALAAVCGIIVSLLLMCGRAVHGLISVRCPRCGQGGRRSSTCPMDRSCAWRPISCCSAADLDVRLQLPGRQIPRPCQHVAVGAAADGVPREFSAVHGATVVTGFIAKAPGRGVD